MVDVNNCFLVVYVDGQACGFGRHGGLPLPTGFLGFGGGQFFDLGAEE